MSRETPPEAHSPEPGTREPSRVAELPSALDRMDELLARFAERQPVLFLDYDGTLTPIVERPEDAVLPGDMRRVLERLARRYPVAVVSGRGRPDVEERVGLPGLYYAGSHGFDIAGPAGADVTFEAAAEVVPVVETVTRALEAELAAVPGAQVEPKRFTVAVHYRRVAPEDVERLEKIVERQVAAHPELRKAGGKKVWEIRPAIDWDKGRAVQWLLAVVARARGLTPGTILPVYLGDDETDEDAFRALARHTPPGVGVLVAPASPSANPSADAPRATAATLRLDDPDAVRRFLERLAANAGPS